MATYLINGKKVKSETPLSEDEIDEIAGQIGTEQPAKQPEESRPVAEQPAASGQGPQAEAKPTEEGPSAGAIAGGVAAEIAAAEGLKYAGAFAGPWGYAAGATAGGITGSILAQEIENPNKPISWGRVVADTALNFIPGQKLFKGAKATTKVGKALVGTGQVAARGAVGAGLATGAQAVEKGIEEQRMLTPEEAKIAAGTGFALGGGLEIAEKAFKAFSPKVQKIFQKSPKEIDDLVKTGDPDAIRAIDEIVNASGIEPEALASKSDEEFVRKVIDREAAPKLEMAAPKEPTSQGVDVNVATDSKGVAFDEKPTQAIDSEQLSKKQERSFYDRYLEDEVEITESDFRFPNSKQQYVAPGGYVNIVNQKNLSELTDKDFVYHETNLKNIRSIVSRLKQGPRRSNLWVSDSIDLALGQGGSGYVLKLNPMFVNGSKTKSISNQIMNEIGSGKFEYNLTKTLPKSVSSIIAPNKKGVDALKKTKGFENIFDFDDVKEVNGKFEIPAKIKKETEAPNTSTTNASEIESAISIRGSSKAKPKLEDDIQNAIDYENYPIVKKDQFVDVETIPQKKEVGITDQVKEPKVFEYDIPEEPSIAKSISQLAQGFKSRFAPSLVTGGKTIAAEAKKAESIAGAGKSTGAILESKINRVVSKSKNPEEANRLAYEFVNGKIDELPVDLKSIESDLLQGRKWIGEYQDELLQNHYNGQRPLEEPLLREIERSRNDGDYLTKPYLFFESPAYKPSKQQEAALKGGLVRNGMTREDADVYINQLNANRAGGPDDISNFVFQSPGGILKERKDLIPELRNYLGEVTQTGSRLSATMSKLSRINAYDTADFNIKTTLRDMGIAKTKADGIAPTDQPLNLRRTPRLLPDQPLPEDQLYVPVEVQRSIDSLYGANVDNNGIDHTTGVLLDLLQTGSSVSKAVKTLLNPSSYTVQPVGNMVLAMAAGANPFKGLGRGVKYGLMQYKPIASRMDIKSIGEFKKLSELNLIGQSLIESDINAGLKGPALGRVAQKALSPFGKAYSIADTAFRNSVSEANSKLINDIAPQLAVSKESGRILNEVVSAMTNATYPNYDYSSQALKTLSKYSAGVSQFATYTFELMRTAWNQGRMAKMMIDGSMADFLESRVGPVNRDKLRNEGFSRMAKLSAALATPIAAANLYNSRAGNTDKKKEQALKESVLPSYEKDNMLAIHEDEDGQYYVTNLSYAMPQSDISSVFMSAFNGKDFKESTSNALGTMYAKIAGDENFLIAPMQNAIGNYVPATDKKISYKVNPVENFLERAGWFAGKAFTTGFQREVEKATRAYNPTTAEELGLRMAGLRVKRYDPVEGVGFHLRDARKSLDGIRSMYSSATYNLAGADLDAKYNELNKDYRDNFQVLSRHVNNMKTLGFPKGKIIQAMVDSGIGDRNTLLAINGYTPSIPRVKEVTPSTELDRISQLSERDQMKEIRAIEDLNMRKKVLSLRKKRMIDKRRGITEEDQLWKGLEEKEQIDIALDMMKNHSDPDAVLRGLIRKGQVSPKTSIDIKKRFQAEKSLAR